VVKDKVCSGPRVIESERVVVSNAGRQCGAGAIAGEFKGYFCWSEIEKKTADIGGPSTHARDAAEENEAEEGCVKIPHERLLLQGHAFEEKESADAGAGKVADDDGTVAAIPENGVGL
jgi:hypothetical protein